MVDITEVVDLVDIIVNENHIRRMPILRRATQAITEAVAARDRTGTTNKDHILEINEVKYSFKCLHKMSFIKNFSKVKY